MSWPQRVVDYKLMNRLTSIGILSCQYQHNHSHTGNQTEATGNCKLFHGTELSTEELEKTSSNETCNPISKIKDIVFHEKITLHFLLQ